jgi:hypothetical protein
LWLLLAIFRFAACEERGSIWPDMRIEDLWDETSILYRVRVGIMTIFGDCASIRFSAAFSDEKSARVFSQLPRDQRLICKKELLQKVFSPENPRSSFIS